MVMEAKPLDHSQKYTFDTEEKIVKTAGYVSKKAKSELEGAGNDGEETSIDETQKTLQRCSELDELIARIRN